MQSSDFNLKTELSFIAEKLKMTDTERKAVEKIYKNTIDSLSGRNRRCIIAGAIYLVAGDKYRQKDIVTACGITEPPLRNVVKHIRNNGYSIEQQC